MAVRPQCNRFALSLDTAEAMYGVPVPVTDISERIDPREPVFINPTQERRDNAAIIKGTEFPTDPENRSVLISKDIDIPFSVDAGLSTLGWCLSLAFGGRMSDDVSITTDPVATYQHDFWAADLCSADQYPTASMILGFVGAMESNLLVKGALLNELRLVLSEPGILELSGTFFTDGSTTAMPAYTFPTEDMNVPSEFLNNTQCDFLIANKTITPLVSQRLKLRGFEFAINNNLDREDARNQLTTGTVNLSSLQSGNREYTMSVTVEGHQGDPFWRDFDAGQAKSVQLYVEHTAPATTLGGRLLSIRADDTIIESIDDIGFDGIRDRMRLGFKLFAKDASTYRAGRVGLTPIFVELRNGDEEYLVVP